jgi:hypothetical protein
MIADVDVSCLVQSPGVAYSIVEEETAQSRRMRNELNETNVISYTHSLANLAKTTNLVTFNEKIENESRIREFGVRYIRRTGAAAGIGSARFAHVWFETTVPRAIRCAELPIFAHICRRRVRKITIQKTNSSVHGIVDRQARRCAREEY